MENQENLDVVFTFQALQHSPKIPKKLKWKNLAKKNKSFSENPLQLHSNCNQDSKISSPLRQREPLVELNTEFLSLKNQQTLSIQANTVNTQAQLKNREGSSKGVEEINKMNSSIQNKSINQQSINQKSKNLSCTKTATESKINLVERRKQIAQKEGTKFLPMIRKQQNDHLQILAKRVKLTHCTDSKNVRQYPREISASFVYVF